MDRAALPVGTWLGEVELMRVLAVGGFGIVYLGALAWNRTTPLVFLSVDDVAADVDLTLLGVDDEHRRHQHYHLSHKPNSDNHACHIWHPI